MRLFGLLFFLCAVIAIYEVHGVNDHYTFRALWYNKRASMTLPYVLKYYMSDNTVEVIDDSDKTVYFPRGKVKHVKQKYMMLGALFKIGCKKFSIIDYGDEFTKKTLGYHNENTYAMIKPEAVPKAGEIITEIYKRQFKIVRLKMTQFSKTQAGYFYQEHVDRDFFQELLGYMTSGPVIGMTLRSPNAILKWRGIIGPNDVDQAKVQFKGTLRGVYGSNRTMNAVHGADSPDSVKRETDFIFNPNDLKNMDTPKSSATFKSSTVCTVKLGAEHHSKLGAIVNNAQKKGFKLTGLQMFYRKYCNINEFYEVAKNAAKEDLVNDNSWPCIGIEMIDTKNPNRYKVGSTYIMNSDMTPANARSRSPPLLNCVDLNSVGYRPRMG